jgi:hypothetical protein
MRNVFAILILLQFYFNGYCQIDTSKTEIIIIGTIHTGNKYFNHNTLYKLLDSLNPDIILKEYNQVYKPVFGLKTATFLKIINPSIEQLTLQTFSKRNKNIIILPYDTTFQNHNTKKNQKKAEYYARKGYIKEEARIESEVFDRLQIATKEYLDSIYLSNYITKRNNYYTLIADKKLGEINDPQFYNTAKELYKDDEEMIAPLIKKYLKDTALSKEYENKLLFWNERNNYMARQIENISKLNPKKRIIVLTGLNHKYFLVNKLSTKNINTVKLTELGKEL